MQRITLLLDLDDTLLDTNVDAFIPAYFQALSEALKDQVDPGVMLPALMGGTKRMMANDDPSQTLRQVFDTHFFPALGIEREVLQSEIDYFYDEKFPALKSVTNTRPGSRELVEWAFSTGHRVAIATNPLFPLKAIHHRLRWAGLPPEKYPFALVSSYETFHFSKSSPAYFAEVMGQLIWPEDPVVMVGNDIEMDLLPAQKAGLPVYWVKSTDVIAPEHADLPQGTLPGLRSWLERIDLQKLTPDFNTPSAITSTLRSTPAVLSKLVGDFSEQDWHSHPKAGEWCSSEVVKHLLDVEKDNLISIKKMLADDNPFIPGSIREGAPGKTCSRENGLQSFSEFTNLRIRMLEILNNLKSEWSRPARHAIFGSVTVQEYTGFIAGHDRLHIRQTYSAAKSQQDGS
jgi:FMN phosphatase YigB (HAD superfamily)